MALERSRGPFSVFDVVSGEAVFYGKEGRFDGEGITK